MKKTPYIDQQTGEYNLRYNMMNMLEDYYLPTRGNDTATKIDTIKGLEYNAIEDVAFLRDEMLAALKVPKAFFGFEKDLTGKDNYTAFGKSINEDLTKDPTVVASKYALLSAAWFFNKNGLHKLADGGATDAVVTQITKRVNGGTIGLADRIKHFKEYHALLA